MLKEFGRFAAHWLVSAVLIIVPFFVCTWLAVNFHSNTDIIVLAIFLPPITAVAVWSWWLTGK